MTVEEKASEFLNSIGGNSLGSPINAAYEGFLAGYNEAMRWRDVNEELPPNPNTVFIKYETPQYLVRYGVGRYLDIRGKNPWLTYDCVNRAVTHWRPIEYYKNNG